MSIVENLFKIIQAQPLREKILITSNHAVGHQIRELVSKEYGVVPNITVQTVQQLAFDRAKLALRKDKKTYLSDSEAYWVVYNLLCRIVETGDYHFESNLLSRGYVDAFHRAVLDLRQAWLTSEDIQPDFFEQNQKGVLMKQLLQMYETYLSGNGLVDLTGLLTYVSPLQGAQVIIHEHVNPSFLQQQILHKITEGNFESLTGDAPFFHKDSLFPAEKTSYFHATGKLAELKEVLRRMAKDRTAYDNVEIIASDYEGYLSAAVGLSKLHNIPMTFSKGLPIQYTSMGKAAFRYLQWVESNFQVEPILQALKDNTIKLAKEDRENFSSSKLVRLLEKLGIGWGKDRYKLIEKAAEAETDDGNKLALKWAATFFQKLFAKLPRQGGYGPQVLLKGLASFLDTYVPPGSEEEAAILSAIKDLQTQVASTEEVTMDVETALDFVYDLLEKIRVQVNAMAQPGCLHLSSIHDGGYSGRKSTFIVGMEEGNWSISNRQDPILLDEERERLSHRLRTSTMLSKQRQVERDSRLGAIRHTCTLSFCSVSTLDTQLKQPAYELFQVFRHTSANEEADMEQLYTHLGEQIYFSGSSLAHNDTNETEAWLRSIIGKEKVVVDGKEPLLDHYQLIARGNQALEARRSKEVTSYDGVLSVNLSEEDVASLRLSATKLESLAECSLKFYFKDILGIRPPEKKRFDRTRWLEAMDRGSLLHEVFQKYMAIRIEEDRIDEPHDRGLLRAITEEVITHYQDMVPAPSEHIAQKEIHDIYKDVEVFIGQEEERTTRPKHVELSIHPEGGYFDVKLSEELTLSIRGFVDRVDEIAPHVYRIYDYKTGKATKFEKESYFAKGTQLQHALYAIAVEQWLQQNEDPEAIVQESVYYFPTQRGLGKEVIREQDCRDSLAALIDNLLGVIRNGAFLPTDDGDQCRWCDYKTVCGEHAVWKKEKELAEERFKPLLEVSQYE